LVVYTYVFITYVYEEFNIIIKWVTLTLIGIVGISSTNTNYNYVRKAFKFQIIIKLKTY